MGLELDDLSEWEARLVQLGLKAAGFYTGTTRGRPGPLTRDALRRYREAEGAVDSFPEIFAQVAEAEVGEKEYGNNGGPAVRRYQGASWLQPGAWPWCAAFVCWVYREAVVRTERPAPFSRPRTAGAWDFERWARDNGVPLLKPATSETVRRGDIVVFTFSHIGIAVADEQGGLVETVEGNTNDAGSREGDGVYRKKRAKRKIRSVIRLG